MTDWYDDRCTELQQLLELNNNRTAFSDRWNKQVLARFRGFLRSLVQQQPTLPTFLAQCSVGELECLLRKSISSHAVRNERVRSTKHHHHARDHASWALRFVRGVMRPHIGCSVDSMSMKSLLAGIPNQRSATSSLAHRRTFTDAEMTAMLARCETARDRLLFALLEQIGLRNSALCFLRRSHFFTETDQLKSSCVVQEKGNKTRVFACTSPGLRSALENFREIGAKNTDFVFNDRDPARPLASHLLNARLRHIASQAGVSGRVSAHTFRATLVTRLVRAGNSLEMVSKFLGHNDVATTASHYWFPELPELPQLPDLPQLSLYEPKNPSPLIQEQRKALNSIVITFVGLCGSDTMQRVRARIPNFDQLLLLLTWEDKSFSFN